MTSSRTAVRLGAVVGTAITGLVLMAAPALAVEQSLDIGNIHLGHGGVIRDGTRLYACDDRADGTGVSTQVLLDSGYTEKVGDGNGSKAGCGQKDLTGRFYATKYRVCWGDPSENICTGWKKAF